MKVLDHNDSTHSITLIPRFYPSTDLTLTFYNEATQVETTAVDTYSITDGKMTINFSFTFTEDERYQVKIEDSSDIVYRGKILITDQTPQSYRQDNGEYIYEP